MVRIDAKDTLTFLNRKATKPLLESLKEQFGFEGELDYAFVQNTINNIYIVKRDIDVIDTSELRINNIGMYFAEIQKRGDLRLSIEGSQLIGPQCTKNVLDLDDTQAQDWMKGYELETTCALKGFVLVRHNGDFMGTGQVKLGKLLNYVPKARRVHATIAPIEEDENVIE